MTETEKSKWEVWLDDPRGNRLALLDTALGFSVTRVVNQVGTFAVTLPDTFDTNMLLLDGIVEFWRAAHDCAMKCVGVGFARKFTYFEMGKTGAVTVAGPDVNDLLNRRISAYPSGSTTVSRTDQADDIMKWAVIWDMGSSAPAARSLSALGFDVGYYTQGGATCTMEYGWRNLLQTLTRAAQSSFDAGLPIYFDIIPTILSPGSMGFVFETFNGQRGLDHSSALNQVVFSKEWGNLVDPILEYDYTAEANYVYVGGQGEGAERTIYELGNTPRISLSPWNRREVFIDARNINSLTDTNGLAARAKEALEEYKPRWRFAGTLLDTPQARYGKDWEFGDKIVVQYRGMRIVGMAKAVTLSVDSSGRESIQARVEVMG